MFYAVESVTNFRSSVSGQQTSETVKLVNAEDVPIQFVFEEKSLFMADYSCSLTAEPLSGWIPPKSSQPICFTFCPASDKDVNFNVVCNIKRKSKPLTLNVKAEGYSMDSVLLCEDSNGTKVELFPASLNNINFGDVSG